MHDGDLAPGVGEKVMQAQGNIDVIVDDKNSGGLLSSGVGSRHVVPLQVLCASKGGISRFSVSIPHKRDGHCDETIVVCEIKDGRLQERRVKLKKGAGRRLKHCS